MAGVAMFREDGSDVAVEVSFWSSIGRLRTEGRYWSKQENRRQE